MNQRMPGENHDNVTPCYTSVAECHHKESMAICIKDAKQQYHGRPPVF